MNRYPMGTVKRDYEPLPTALELALMSFRKDVVQREMLLLALFEQALLEADRDWEPPR